MLSKFIGILLVLVLFISFNLCYSNDIVLPENLKKQIKTEFRLKKTRFRINEPIIVDVYVENRTKRDIEQNQFSPISSSVGLPRFVFARVPNGKAFSSIPPGLFGDDWNSWYQPASGNKAFNVGAFVLQSGKRIHLLHGDLQQMIKHAHDHCQRALDERLLLDERPESAGTKKEYQNIVRFAGEFLSGGIYDIHVLAYSKSKTIRIHILNDRTLNLSINTLTKGLKNGSSISEKANLLMKEYS